jgi:hypothetical protein
MVYRQYSVDFNIQAYIKHLDTNIARAFSTLNLEIPGTGKNSSLIYKAIQI